MTNMDWARDRRKRTRALEIRQNVRDVVMRSTGSGDRIPPPRPPILDSREQPISLPRVSILEERE